MIKISLNSVKSYLSRDEMRVVSGGLVAPIGPNCKGDSGCPDGCSSQNASGVRTCDRCCIA